MIICIKTPEGTCSFDSSQLPLPRVGDLIDFTMIPYKVESVRFCLGREHPIIQVDCAQVH